MAKLIEGKQSVVTLTEKCTIRIPLAILKKLGIKVGDKVHWTCIDNTIQLTKERPVMSIPVYNPSVESFEDNLNG